MPEFDGQSVRRIARSVLTTEGMLRSSPAQRGQSSQPETGLMLLRAAAQINSDASGTANVVTIDDYDNLEEHTGEENERTVLNPADNTPIWDNAYLFATYGAGGLIVLLHFGATKVRATVNKSGGVCPDDATFNVNNVTGMDGSYPTATISGVRNDVNGDWDNTDVVVLHWDNDSNAWQAESKTGKVKVDKDDTYDYLEDQFNAHGSPAYSPGSHTVAYTDTASGKIRVYYDTPSGSSTDEKVKVNASDTTAYLEDQFNDHNSPTYSAGSHTLAHTDTVDVGGDKQIRVFYDTPEENTDEKVKVNSGDVAAYLEDQFYNHGSPAYSAGSHTIAYTDTVSGQIRVYYETPEENTDEKVKVNSGDTAAYLEDQIHNHDAVTYNATWYQECYADTTGGKLRLFVDVGLVSVFDADEPEYLEDQFNAHGTPAYSAGSHTIAYTDTSSGKIRIYYDTPEEGTDEKVKVNSGDTAAYLEDQFYSHGSPAYSAGSHTVAYTDTVSGQIRVYYDTPEESTDEKVKVNSGDTAAYLEDQFADHNATGQYDSSHDIAMDVDTVTGQLRVFFDASAITTGYSSTELRIPVKDGATWKWMSIVDLLKELTGWDSGDDQSIGHDSAGDPEWQDDSTC